MGIIDRLLVWLLSGGFLGVVEGILFICILEGVNVFGLMVFILKGLIILFLIDIIFFNGRYFVFEN